jgi:aspartate aminotransferase-like enzyme
MNSMRLNSHPERPALPANPGPTNVPDRILRAMDYPTIDHRGPEFNALVKKVLRSIRQVFQTKQPVIVYPASGTGAWEAALVNTLNAGDTVLMWETGHFASLWKKMADKLASSRSSWAATGVSPRIPRRSKSASRKTPATRSRRCASSTTRPRLAW